MSGDGLERAVRALRASGDGPPPEGLAMRARVLRAMESRGRARRRLVRWGLPLAATLAFSSAWAASNGYLGAPFRAVRAVVSANHEGTISPGAATPPARVVLAPPPATSAAPDPSPPVVPVEELPVAPVPVAPSGQTSLRTERPVRAPVVTGDPGASPTGAPSAEDTLYAAAHRAHFVDRDPAGALNAWDAYLRAAPSGVLVPEARYNRALCLVRLGRREEARAALQPFAQGGYGGYRQHEAAELVAGLGTAP